MERTGTEAAATQPGEGERGETERTQAGRTRTEGTAPEPAATTGSDGAPHAEDEATEKPQAPPGEAPPRDPRTENPSPGNPGAQDPPAQDPPSPQPRSPHPPKKPRRRLRWTRRCVPALVLLLLLPLLGTQIALRLNYTGDYADGTRTRGKDALWLGHAWVDGRKKDADVTALAARLKDTGIRDLYVHTGPMEHDGTLPADRCPRARWFIDAMHRALPGVRVQAWLGDELATEKPDGMRLELSGTRAAVLRTTRQVLDTGFDGAHFDLEPLHSGDGHYLDLLDALHRETAARDVPLSVAAHQIDPLPGLHSVVGAFTGHPKWWSQEFFGQVARRVDQIAVMSYDTMQFWQSTYGGYVAQQTSLALEVTPDSTDLLMGLPFYHENTPSHRAGAETVPAAVRGVRLGLSRTDAGRANFGVALYVDFAATEDDWTAYRTGWVK
ncbi:hypothetical protein [Streptomyces sp. NPDC057386]|uniref:hypothetical protein n=1 Tax=unclassified Streptomyces TaxID=2593676 RepID=UPI0036270AB5